MTASAQEMAAVGLLRASAQAAAVRERASQSAQALEAAGLAQAVEAPRARAVSGWPQSKSRTILGQKSLRPQATRPNARCWRRSE